MTASERQRRSRSLRALRARQAIDAELQAFVRAGLRGEDDEAQAEIAEFLAGLPDVIDRLRRDLDAIRAKSSRKASDERSR